MPFALRVPVTFAPVPVITTVVLPADTKSTLPLLLTVMFEVPSINVPVKNDAETKFPPATLPKVPLPVASTAPAVVKLPPDTLPVAATTPTVVIFPPITLPVASTTPAVVMFPPATLPVAETSPTVVKFPPITLPVTSTTPADVKLEPDTLPVNVPTPVATIPVESIFAISEPPTFNSMLPSAAGIETLDVPFAIPDVSIPDKNAPLP